jgi:prolyl-tRNA synthetase
MRTRLFLRTTEFLWQGGHTAHETEQEALDETMRMLRVYQDFAENEAAIPVVPGRKSQTEKFAGAVNSFTIEAMMGDKKALQSGTSHFMGQNFAKAFDIQYLDRNNELQHCWTTSWGVSTRMIGAIIMTHGDDKGLVMPPRLAPVQVVIVPIFKTDEERSKVLPAADEIFNKLKAAGIRVKMDAREEFTPGWKFNDWEMRGVPLRIEVGPKDVANQAAVLARRDIPGKEGKTFGVPVAEIDTKVSEMLAVIQKALFDKALAFREEHTHHPENYEDFKKAVEDGFALAWWCGSAECEDKIKQDTKATNRCIPLDQPGGTGKCIFCGKESTEKAIFSKAY